MIFMYLILYAIMTKLLCTNYCVQTTTYMIVQTTTVQTTVYKLSLTKLFVLSDVIYSLHRWK